MTTVKINIVQIDDMCTVGFTQFIHPNQWKIKESYITNNPERWHLLNKVWALEHHAINAFQQTIEDTIKTLPARTEQQSQQVLTAIRTTTINNNYVNHRLIELETEVKRLRQQLRQVDADKTVFLYEESDSKSIFCWLQGDHKRFEGIYLNSVNYLQMSADRYQQLKEQLWEQFYGTNEPYEFKPTILTIQEARTMIQQGATFVQCGCV